MPPKKKTQEAKEAGVESLAKPNPGLLHSLPRRSIAAIIADLSRPLPLECIARIDATAKRPAQDYVHWHTVEAVLDTYAPGWEGRIVRIKKVGAAAAEKRRWKADPERNPDDKPSGRLVVVYRITIHAAEGSFSQDGDGMEDEDKDEYGDAMNSAVATAKKRAAANFGVGRLQLYDKDKKTAAFLAAARKDKEEALQRLARIADAKGTPRKALLAWLCREAGVVGTSDIPVYMTKAMIRELEGWPDVVNTETGELLGVKDGEASPLAQLQAEITAIYNESPQMQSHRGMHKAIFFSSFDIERPEQLEQQPLEVLEKGIGLYRELTARLPQWDNKAHPDAWIRDQKRLMATHASETVTAVPRTPEQLKELKGLPEYLLDKDEVQLRAEDEEAMGEEDIHTPTRFDDGSGAPYVPASWPHMPQGRKG